MFVFFEQLSDNARIWIYPMDRVARPEEEDCINEKMRIFCDRWESHGQSLKSSYKLLYHQFLIIAVEYPQVGDLGGCAVDRSVHVLHELHETLGVDFLVRDKLFFQIGDKRIVYPHSKLNDIFLSGVLTGSTLTFNIQAATKGELERKKWLPVADSWMAKYIPLEK